jgi:hypothetical protein
MITLGRSRADWEGVSGLRGKLTYANVMVTILAFVILGGGGAYAASKLAKNSVGTKQLKTGAVTGAKVKDSSLTGADIDVSTLASVPSASRAVHADSATTATSAGNATTATNAAHAADSDTVGGLAPSALGSGVMSGRLDGFPAGIGDRLAWAVPTGQTAFGAAGPTEVETLSPAQDMVVRDLSVHLTAPPGNNNEWLLQIVVDGQMAMECNARGPAQDCSNQAGFGAVPAGGRLSVFAALGGGFAPNPAETFEWGFRLAAAAAE